MKHPTGMINCTPEPGVLNGFRNYTFPGQVAGALMEIADNSLGEDRGDATQIWITHYTRTHILEVLDNGNGMADPGVSLVVQLGAGASQLGLSKPGSKDIGMFGIGATMALLYLADVIEVWTLRKGRMVNHTKVDYPALIKANEFPSVSPLFMRADLGNCPADLLALGHGTKIVMKLRKGRKFGVEATIDKLRATYAPGLRLNRHLTWKSVTGNVITPIPLEAPALAFDAGKSVHFENVVVDAELGLTFRGEVGIIGNLPAYRSNVAVGFNARVLFNTRDCYGIETEKYAVSNVAGWLDLSPEWKPFLASTKSEIDDGNLHDALMLKVFEAIRPILAQSDEEGTEVKFAGIGFTTGVALSTPSPEETKVASTGGTSGNGEGTDEFLGGAGNGTGGGGGGGGPEPGNGHGDNPDTTKPGSGTQARVSAGGAGSGHDKTDPIRIKYVSNENLGGVNNPDGSVLTYGYMARTLTGDHIITLLLNKQHPDVLALLPGTDSGSVNARAYHLLVTGDIAAGFAFSADVARAFPMPVQKILVELDDADKVRYLQTVLMGRLRKIEA